MSEPAAAAANTTSPLPVELQQLLATLRRIGRPLTIDLSGPDEGPMPRMAAIVESLSQGTGGLVEGRRSTSGDGPPAMILHAPEGSSLHYLATPEGPEAPPFSETLVALAQGTGRDTPWSAGLERLEPPATIDVFIAATCPNCPAAVHSALTLALAAGGTRVRIIDVAHNPQLADGIRTVPTTVIDGELTFTVAQPVARLADLLRSRGSAEYEELSFRSLLDAGRFAVAAAGLVAGRWHRLYAQRWCSSSFGDRVNLMLLADEALERDPQALDAAVKDLLPAVGARDAALRGDTADLLGRIGHEGSLPALRAALDDDDAEVAEVAAEAIAAITARSRDATATGNLT